MDELFFLGKVVSKDTNSYIIQVDKTNINNYPTGELVDRIVESNHRLEIGKVYYFYKALKSGKKVTIQGYTLLPDWPENTKQHTINEVIRDTTNWPELILSNKFPCDIWEKQSQ